MNLMRAVIEERWTHLDDGEDYVINGAEAKAFRANILAKVFDQHKTTQNDHPGFFDRDPERKEAIYTLMAAAPALARALTQIKRASCEAEETAATWKDIAGRMETIAREALKGIGLED